MKKGHLAALIIYVAMVVSVPILAVIVATSARDVSWIGPVENFIKKENWKPGMEYEPLNEWSFFLYENGEEQYFFLNSQSEFISYIRGLIDSVDRQVRNSISKESVDEILAADKVLELVHRFPENFGPFGKYGSFEVAYFVLEDNSGKGLQGIMIMQDRLAGEYSHYSVWQITNWALW